MKKKHSVLLYISTIEISLLKLHRQLLPKEDGALINLEIRGFNGDFRGCTLDWRSFLVCLFHADFVFKHTTANID